MGDLTREDVKRYMDRYAYQTRHGTEAGADTVLCELVSAIVSQIATVTKELGEFRTALEREVQALVTADRYLAAVMTERDEARDWVRKLTREERVLTCIYCGHAYPPGSPTHGAEVLTAHAMVCTRHPLATAVAALEAAEKAAKHAHRLWDKDEESKASYANRLRDIWKPIETALASIRGAAKAKTGDAR